jgi:hypothetical protein
MLKSRGKWAKLVAAQTSYLAGRPGNVASEKLSDQFLSLIVMSH